MNADVLLVKTVLKYTFGVVPVITGLDKFANLPTDWSHYISENIAGILPFESAVFMKIVGVIEIMAGILVFIKTKQGPMWLS
ncbi:hypothetical protein SAMN04487911_1092 [Arenibacter nanhaiticus]|uniref:DoxX protein n=1 Tax=Arenibacter nanhaiticus TaxID=558155 RepID=A0A1M6FKU1_9FLAO|nr:hypothetical protein [Arenibacter nanhaiticus]SHI98338.1 hypothetical protein SAMN04487911_1092 [Arenibacter nanhaiticus]